MTLIVWGVLLGMGVSELVVRPWMEWRRCRGGRRRARASWGPLRRPGGWFE